MTKIDLSDPILHFVNALSSEQLSRFGWVLSKKENEKVDNATGFSTIDPEITASCDHACNHCWADLNGKHMSLETFEKTLDYCDSQSIKTIQFTGGEPTLNPQFEQMAKMAHERGFTSILRTHARNLPLERDSVNGGKISNADICAKYFDRIIMSLDGLPEYNFDMRPTRYGAGKVAHDESKRTEVAELQFNQTIAGIESLCASSKNMEESTGKRPELHINTVVAKANIEGIGELADFLETSVTQKGWIIDRWDLTQVMPAAINNVERQNSYTITDEQFINALCEASTYSPSIAKRAKPVTEGRSVIVDQKGSVYVGGKVRVDLGDIHNTSFETLASGMREYTNNTDMLNNKDSAYLYYLPDNHIRDANPPIRVSAEKNIHHSVG